MLAIAVVTMMMMRLTITIATVSTVLVMRCSRITSSLLDADIMGLVVIDGVAGQVQDLLDELTQHVMVLGIAVPDGQDVFLRPATDNDSANVLSNFVLLAHNHQQQALPQPGHQTLLQAYAQLTAPGIAFVLPSRSDAMTKDLNVGSGTSSTQFTRSAHSQVCMPELLSRMHCAQFLQVTFVVI